MRCILGGYGPWLIKKKGKTNPVAFCLPPEFGVLTGLFPANGCSCEQCYICLPGNLLVPGTTSHPDLMQVGIQKAVSEFTAHISITGHSMVLTTHKFVWKRLMLIFSQHSLVHLAVLVSCGIACEIIDCFSFFCCIFMRCDLQSTILHNLEHLELTILV